MSAGSSSSLARSSAVMAGGTLVSRILGMVRMVLLAHVIGVLNDAINVWETANTIPNQIYLLLAAGVLNVLLLPQLTRAMTRGKEGQEYSDRLITLVLAVLVTGTVLFVLAAPFVTKLMVLSWPWGSPKLNLAILFAYLCIPQMLFYGLHTLLGQILAAHHKFAAFMWSPALANIVAIAGILAFGQLYPDAADIPVEDWTTGMVLLLALSATAGIALQALVLVPAVRRTGFQWRPRWGFRGVGLGTASVMAFWALADIFLAQGGMTLATNLLGWAVENDAEAPGRAAMNYAFAVFILPHSIIALSVLTAIYPVLSKAAAVDDRTSMAGSAARGLRLLGAAMVPIAVGMLLLAPLLVRVIFPSAGEDAHAAITGILVVLTLGLVPYGVYLLCARVFYSYEDARTPFGFQLAITSVLIVFCLFALTQAPGRVALFVAAGQAVGQTTAACLGLRAVRRRLPKIGVRAVGMGYLRAAAAAVLALIPAWLIVLVLDRPGFWGAVLALAPAGVVFLIGYAVLAYRFGVEEVVTLTAPLLRRVPGMRGLADEAPGLREEIAGGTPEGSDPTADTTPDQAPDATPDPAPAAGAATRAGETRHTPDVVGHHAAGASQVETVPEDGTLGWNKALTGADRKDGEMDQLEVGTRVGDRYALDELLARREGGTLDYWSARDTTLGRLVAVTVLPADGEHAATAEAVVDGARRVASVDDPRLVRVLDVGIDDGLCWIVEEGLSEAESLASLVAERPLPAEEARRVIGEAAAGLESARRRGLHHLYLNPHAVLRTSDGTVKVSGVGMAAALEDTDDVTPVEASLIDTADLVSLLYTGLTGRWPGEEEMPGLPSARRGSDGSLPAPSEMVPGVPGDLDALCRMVHGADADLSQAPRTPGELARQLSPWASEMVREDDDRRRPSPSDATSMVPKPFYRSPDEVDEDDPYAAYRPGQDAGSRGVGTGAAGAGAAGAAGAAAAGAGREADGREADGRGGGERRHGAREVEDDGTGDVGGLLGSRKGLPEEDRTSRPSTAELLGVRSTGERISPRGMRTSGGATSAVAGAPREQHVDASGLREERSTGAQTMAVLLVVVGILGLTAVLGWSILRGFGGDSGDTAAPGGSPAVSPTAGENGAGPEGDGSTADPEATAGEGTEDGTGDGTQEGTDGADDGSEDGEGEPTAPGASGGVLPILGITSFDPQGDGDENNDLTPLAVDGDDSTEWVSRTYYAPGWGGLKTGTGLILDLGEGAEVSGVDVALGEGQMGAELYLSERPSLQGAQELASSGDLSGSWEVDLDDPATGRYLILWFTDANSTPAGEQVSVRDITVR
ncbi:lipid II flippase MurJ [Ornithinimicrobium sp. Y1694]|uniref:murein biosynthesis integral membrane protein MurJ n=1 Tax=Ornithinimicrobium sp. Y1694 TaxID=3418590 RepID=UPI003CF20ABB